jgi:hypothetical protein
MMNKSRKMTRKRSKLPASFEKIPRPLQSGGDIITKRMTFYENINSGTGATYIASYMAQSIPATEWSSFAARYQEYRVKEIVVTVYPYYNVSQQGVTGAVPLDIYVLFDFLAGNTPSSITGAIADERAVVQSSGQPSFSYTTTWDKNPNAKLWTTTSSPVPTSSTFGIGIYPITTTGTAGAYALLVQWLVELRSSQ